MKTIQIFNVKIIDFVAIAQVCFENPDEANFIAFLVENEIKEVQPDKNCYIFLINEIFQLELKQRRPTIDFIKAFGIKLKNMILNFQILSSIKPLDKVFYFINKWEKDMIFHPNFTMKLRNILLPKYELLQKQKQQQLLDEMEKSVKLEKNLKIIQVLYHTQTNAIIYLNKANILKTNLRIQLTQKQYQQNENLNQMIEEGEECRKLLINSICQIQQFYLTLSSQGEELMKDLMSTNKLDYYRRKKKKLFH